MFSDERQMRGSSGLSDLGGWEPSATAMTPEINRMPLQFQTPTPSTLSASPPDVAMQDTDTDVADTLAMSSGTDAPPPGAPTAAPRRRGPGRPKSGAAANPFTKRVVRHPKQATVTSKTGAQLTLFQYQQFATREQGKVFIRQFAAAQGKRVVIDRTASGGSNIVFVCKSATPCTFRVRIMRSKRRGESLFYVTTLETEHGATCSGKLALTKKQVLDDLRAASEANTTLTLTGADAQSIVETIENRSASVGPGAASTTARNAAQASVLVRTSVDDAGAMTDVQKLEALLTQFQLQHPSAAVHVDTCSDDASALRRAFLMLPYATRIQQASARLLGLDSAVVPNVGVTLELVAKDGNNDAYTLAVALYATDTELNAECYAWFLTQCLSSGLALDVPIICDRTPAVLAAVASLPVACLLIQSTSHLLTALAHVQGGVPLAKDVQTLVLRAQAADTSEEFDAALAAVAAKSAGVAAQLRRVDPGIWAKHCFLRKYALFGAHSAALVASPTSSAHTLASPSEAAAADALDAMMCAHSPLYVVQSVIERCMQAIYERRRNAKLWTRAGQLLTAHGERLQSEQNARAIACRVTPNDDDTGSAYVWDTRSPVPKRRRVCVSTSSCSCPFADQYALPCKHLVAAAKYFNSHGALWDLNARHHAMYLARSYADVYAHTSAVSMPLEEELSWSMSLRVVPVGPTNKCSVCHAFGHNKRRCPSAAGASA